MTSTEAATAILLEAQDRLRQLAAASLNSGDFDDVKRLADLAKTMGELISGRTPSSSADAHRSLGVHSANLIPPSSAPRKSRKQKKKVTRNRKGRGVTVSRRSPVFVREGDTLVKIGKAKRRGEQYVHRAPLRVLELLAKTLAKTKSNEELITMDGLLPLHDVQTGEQVPSYQAYLALAWLRAQNLVYQHGKRGYTVTNPASLLADTQEQFRSLQKHR